jgi:hypothetical protein
LVSGRASMPACSRGQLGNAKMKKVRCGVVAVVVLLTSATSGHAASSAGSGADDAAGIAGTVWEAAKAGTGGLWTATTSLFRTPDPFEYLPEQMPNRDRRFVALMDAAGYRLAAIDTSEGLFGRVRYQFQQQRASSPDDLERIRRGFVEHGAHHSGPIASAERRALRGLLAVNAMTGYQVAFVNIELLPWPKVSFHLTAQDPSTGLAHQGH